MDSRKLKIDATKALSGTIKIGAYEDVKNSEYNDLPHFHDSLAPINTLKFGEFFEKCVGILNSTIKRAGVEEGDRYQMVVKDKIGFRFVVSPSGNPNGNARYGERDVIYPMLHPKHIGLVSKREKREAVQDFWDLKADFIERFHKIKLQLSDAVEDTIGVTDVFDVAVKSPHVTKYNYDTVGHMTINDREISKDAIVFSMNDDWNTYAPYNDQMQEPAMKAGKKRWGRMATPTYGNFEIVCSMKENEVSEDGVETFKLVKLFKIKLYGRDNQYTSTRGSEPRIETYGHEFTGIDVALVIDKFLECYRGFTADWDARLDGLRDKYLAEFVMNEICDEDSETSI